MEIRREGLSCSSLCMKTKHYRATWCMIKHASGHVEGGPLLGHTPNGPWLACLGLPLDLLKLRWTFKIWVLGLLHGLL